MGWLNNYTYKIDFGTLASYLDKVVAVTIDSRDLYLNGKCKANRYDVKIICESGGVLEELDRIFIDTGHLHFKCKPELIDGSYALYYGNTDEISRPKDNRNNIYPFYMDGEFTDKVSIAGIATSYSMPKPDYIKYSNNPVMTPGTKGTDGDFSVLRGSNSMLYEDGTYYVWYDANDYDGTGVGNIDGIQGWTTYLAKSVDLVTWLKANNLPQMAGGIRGQVLLPSPGINQPYIGCMDNLTASNSTVKRLTIDGVTKYYQQHIGSTGLFAGSVPAMPYVSHLSVADTIDAFGSSWTKLGVLVYRTPSSYDWNCTSSVHIFIPPILDKEALINTDTLYLFYSTTWASNGSRRGCGLASIPAGQLNYAGAERGITKISECIPGTENVENPKIEYDPVSGYYYMYLDHIGIIASTEMTVAQTFYWSSDYLNWDITQKSSMIAGEPGAWDGKIIGSLSTGVIKEGMIYHVYDGLSESGFITNISNYGHLGRSIGVAEAEWPWRIGSALKCETAAQLTSTTSFGDGIFTIRLRPIGNCFAGIKLSNNAIYGVARYNDNEGLYKVLNGVYSTTDYGRFYNETKTIRIKKEGAFIYLYCDGIMIGSSSIPDLTYSFYCTDNILIEQCVYTPLNLPNVIGVYAQKPKINSIEYPNSTTESEIIITGTHSSVTAISCNGVFGSIAGNSWSITLGLEVGINNLALSAINLNGEDTITIVIERSIPLATSFETRPIYMKKSGGPKPCRIYVKTPTGMKRNTIKVGRE